MKKKVYVQPSIAAYEMEVEPILAASPVDETKRISGSLDDGSYLDYGGDTKADGIYSPD